jgi:hypothetical protein
MEKRARSDMKPSRSVRRLRPMAGLLFIVAICFVFWQWNLALPDYSLFDDDPSRSLNKASGLVPLEAHIISKCPDTRDALKQLILPVMQRVYDKVDFKLSYIGKTTANDGVECMHGPSECMGNILELCARELYPDPKINLGFIMCLTRDYSHIPDRSLVEDCALEHAIDVQALNDCAVRDDGAHGLELLRHSVERSAEVGVATSCTVRLNNEVYCVRDGGEWTDCPNGSNVNDLVIAIEKLYHRS